MDAAIPDINNDRSIDQTSDPAEDPSREAHGWQALSLRDGIAQEFGDDRDPDRSARPRAKPGSGMRRVLTLKPLEPGWDTLNRL